MAKKQKEVVRELAEPVDSIGHSKYMALAEKNGCPILDIATLLLEGLQAWRHGGHVKTAKTK